MDSNTTTKRRSGELWQPCRQSSCETEPVCLDCHYCDRHCVCPSQEQVVTEQERRQQMVAAARQRLTAWVERLAAGCDPCDVPLEKLTQSGSSLVSPWVSVDDPARRGALLDAVLKHYGDRPSRPGADPMSSRADVVAAMLAGATLSFGTDWYEEIRYETGL